jgi:hypothetical protein
VKLKEWMRSFRLKIIKGQNLFDSQDPYIFVTGNSYIDTNGSLVMGRGAALDLAIKLPYLKAIWGDQITRYYGHLGKYGVLLAKPTDGLDLLGKKGIGIFQTKYHFKDPSNLELIKYSCKALISIMDSLGMEEEKVSMNFPGVGYGQLPFESVLPIVELLPDNVSLYIK